MRIDIYKYMHHGDLSAIKAIEAIPKFPEVIDFISGNSIERLYNMYYNSSLLRITENNSPLITQIVKSGCEMFGVDEVPEIFIQRSYEYFVRAEGIKNNVVIISTALLENLTDEELRMYIIPYIGAFAAGHNKMLFIKKIVDDLGGLLPFPEHVLKIPLNQWNKQKEYTYDRIRLAMSNNLEYAASFIGIEQTTREIMGQTSIEERLECAKKVFEYDAAKGVSRNLQSIITDDAWSSMRLIELFNWYESGEYCQMLDNESGDETC